MRMFNRTYQIRSRRSGLVPVGEVLEELVERAAVKQSFYRPEKRVSPRPQVQKRKLTGLRGLPGQLELPFSASAAPAQAPREPDKPLFDLFPEAYEQE